MMVSWKLTGTTPTQPQRRGCYVATDHERKFRRFWPCTGPFPKVSVADGILRTIFAKLRDFIGKSGWRFRMQQAAHKVVDLMEEQGLRIEVTCGELARHLGLSYSMGGYYRTRLENEGFIDLYREHYLDWETTDRLRDHLDDDTIFIAAPAVHELSIRRWERLFRSHLSLADSDLLMAEKRALSWDSLLAAFRQRAEPNLAEALVP